MEDNIVNSVTELHRQGKWGEIICKYHDHPERNKLLWVFPDESNFEFIKNCAQELICDRILSIGCGSGLLEWMITAATGIPVSGLEVDGTWWHCKYAPPTFIPLLLTSNTLDKDTKRMLNTCNQTDTALLFCYFNNRPAFEEYLKNFSGNVIIIIGPDGKGVHTDPKPFGDVSADWTLYKWQEVRQTKDFIAVYLKCVNK